VEPPRHPNLGDDDVSIVLSRELTAAVRQLSRRDGSTPFFAVFTALMILLRRWTGETDLVAGTVSAGRTRGELENLIGCFMNFLPIRLKMEGNETGREVLARVKRAVLEAYEHLDCPFEKIVAAVRPERESGHNPI